MIVFNQHFAFTHFLDFINEIVVFVSVKCKYGISDCLRPSWYMFFSNMLHTADMLLTILVLHVLTIIDNSDNMLSGWRSTASLPNALLTVHGPNKWVMNLTHLSYYHEYSLLSFHQ